MICEKTLKKLCKDDVTKIENYEQAMADTETWECHHRLELHPDNSLRFTSKSLKNLDLYYNRPASELIFLTKAKHRMMHHKGRTSPAKGMHHTTETRVRISESLKGMKRSPFTEEHRANLRKGQQRRFAKERANKENTNG